MKAIITTWIRTESSAIEREFSDFKTFKAYDFAPSKSITLCADGSVEKLHLNAFPDRTYAVTYYPTDQNLLIKLSPGDKVSDLNIFDNIYVSKELMLEAVEYFFEKQSLNPVQCWVACPQKNLTDEERNGLDEKLSQMFHKYGDPFVIN